MPGGGGERPQPNMQLATALATIHATAFAGEGRPWSAPELLALLAEPVVAVRLARRECVDAGGELAPVGSALYRAVSDEAELLTIAVLPEARRQGIGAGLLAASEAGARASGAVRMLLEVAEGNVAAATLYHRAGFREVGRRKGYYRRPEGGPDNAVVLAKTL